MGIPVFNTAGWPMEVKYAEQANRFPVSAHSDTLVSYEHIINFGSPYNKIATHSWQFSCRMQHFTGSDNHPGKCMCYILALLKKHPVCAISWPPSQTNQRI